MSFFGNAASSNSSGFGSVSGSGFGAGNLGGGSGSFVAPGAFGRNTPPAGQPQQQQRQGRGGNKGKGGRGAKGTAASPAGRGSFGNIPPQPPPPGSSFGGASSFSGGFGGNPSGSSAFGAKPFGNLSPLAPLSTPGRKPGGGGASPMGGSAGAKSPFSPSLGNSGFGSTFAGGGGFSSSPGGTAFQPSAARGMGAAVRAQPSPFGGRATAPPQPVLWGQQPQQPPQQQQQQNRLKSQGQGKAGVSGGGGDGMEVEQAPKTRKPRQQKQPLQQPPMPFQPPLQPPPPQQQFQPFQAQPLQTASFLPQPPPPQLQPQFQAFQPQPSAPQGGGLFGPQSQPVQAPFTPQPAAGVGDGMETEQPSHAVGGKGGRKVGKGGGADGAGQMETFGTKSASAMVCNNWRKSGTCKFGANCHFQHSRAATGAAGGPGGTAGDGTQTVAPIGGGKGGGGGGASGKGATGKGTAGKGKGASGGQGVCRFGARCSNRKCAYAHPDRASQASQPQVSVDGQGATATTTVGGNENSKRSLKDRMGVPPPLSSSSAATATGAATAAAGAAGLKFNVSNRGKGLAARLGDQHGIKQPSPPMSVGQRVQALYEGEWWPATIVQVHEGGNQVDVKYAGVSGDDAMEYGKAWGSEVLAWGSGDDHEGDDDDDYEEEEEAEEEEDEAENGGNEGDDDDDDDDEEEDAQGKNGAVLNAHGHATAPLEGRPSLKSRLGMSPNTTFLGRLMSGVQRTNNRLIAQSQDAAKAYQSEVVTQASPPGAATAAAASTTSSFRKRSPSQQQRQQTAAAAASKPVLLPPKRGQDDVDEEEDEEDGDPWSAGALRRAQYADTNADDDEEDEDQDQEEVDDEDGDDEGAHEANRRTEGHTAKTPTASTKATLSHAADPWTPHAANNRAQRFQQRVPLTPATPADTPATDTPATVHRFSLTSPESSRTAKKSSIGDGAGGKGSGVGGGGNGGHKNANQGGGGGGEEEVLVGLCTTMAPREALSGQVFEFAYQEFGEAWQDVLVSRHIRSAAGHVYAPEEVRTEATLALTCDHLVANVMDADTSPSPRLEHAFGGQPPYTLEVWLYVWNRLRAMRVEYKLQGILTRGSGSAVGVYEQMARFHLTMDMELQGNTMRNRDRAEIEARGDPIVLSEFYHSEKDSRSAITEVLNELDLLYDAACDKRDASLLGPLGFHGMAEGCGLILLNSMDNDDGTFSSRFLAKLAAREDWAHTLASPPMLFAVAVLATRRRHDFAHFFLLLRSAPYSEGCVMHKYVGGDHGMRAVAIRALHKTWAPSEQRISLSHLTTVLCCSGNDETQALLEDFGVISEVDDDDDEVVAIFGKDRGKREFVAWPYSAMGEEERKNRYRPLEVVLTKRGGPAGPGTSPGTDARTGNRLYYTSRASIVRGITATSYASSSSSAGRNVHDEAGIAKSYGLDQPHLAGTGAGYSRWQRSTTTHATSAARSDGSQPLARVVLRSPRNLSVAATAAATAGVPFDAASRDLSLRSPLPPDAALAAPSASPQRRAEDQARAAVAAAVDDARQKKAAEAAAAASARAVQRQQERMEEEEAARQQQAAQRKAIEQRQQQQQQLLQQQQQQQEKERQVRAQEQAEANARATHALKLQAEQQAWAAQQQQLAAAAANQTAANQKAVAQRKNAAAARKQERVSTWARLAKHWVLHRNRVRVQAAVAQCCAQRAKQLASCRKLYLRRWVLAYAARAAERERLMHEARMREAAVREALSSLDVGASTEHYHRMNDHRASNATNFEGENQDQGAGAADYGLDNSSSSSSSSNEWTAARAAAATAHWQPAVSAPVRFAASTTGRMIAALGLVPPPPLRPQRQSQQQQQQQPSPPPHQQKKFKQQPQQKDARSLGEQFLPLEAVLRRAAYGGGSSGSTAPTGGGGPRRAYFTAAASASSSSKTKQQPMLNAGAAPGMGQVHRFAAWEKARMEYREGVLDAAWREDYENDGDENLQVEGEAPSLMQQQQHAEDGPGQLSQSDFGQELIGHQDEDAAVVEGVGAALEAVALVQRHTSYQSRSAHASSSPSSSSSSSTVKKRARSGTHTTAPSAKSSGGDGNSGGALSWSSLRSHPACSNKRLPSATLGGGSGGSGSSNASSGAVKKSRVGDAASGVSSSPGGDRSPGSGSGGGSGGAALAPEASAMLDAERALAQSRKAAKMAVAAPAAASVATANSKPVAYSYAAALRASAPSTSAAAGPTPGAGSAAVGLTTDIYREKAAAQSFEASLRAFAVVPTGSAAPPLANTRATSKAHRRSLPGNAGVTHLQFPQMAPRQDHKATHLQIENAAYEARLRELMR